MIGTPCANNWYGIECRNGTMVELNLDYNNLRGRIPSSLGGLCCVQDFNLNDVRLITHTHIYIATPFMIFNDGCPLHQKRRIP